MKPRYRRLTLLLLVIPLVCTARAAAVRFQDVPEGHWAAADIALCAERGIIPGRDGTLFGLGNPMERGAFVTALANLMGWEAESGAGLPYRDMTPDLPCLGAVAAAYRHGAVTAQTETFRPYDAITREELAVMLVRALGYRSIAGLADQAPYQDVTANGGYLSVARELGLMSGNQGLFLPKTAATREQAAAVLARLYRKLHETPLRRVGILSSPAGLENGAYLDVMAVRAVQLTGGVEPSFTMDPSDAAALREMARNGGKTVLLYASGEALTWAEASQLPALCEGYDGLFLDLSGQADESCLRRLREGLGSRLLYVTVPAPASGALVPYETLAKSADVLVVRVPGERRMVKDFPSDPVEPLEQVYDALRQLKRRVGAEKLSLLTDTTGCLWTGGVPGEQLDGNGIAALLSRPGVQKRYSERYACAYAYLPADGTHAEQVVWYLDGPSAAARVRLLRLMGAEGLCLTDADNCGADVKSALL